MSILLFILIITFSTAQSISNKSFNLRNPDGGEYTYTCISCAVAALFFAVTAGGNLTFVKELYVYSFGFALSYGAAILFLFLAIKHGSLALTTLVMSYSLIIPALVGLVVYDEKASVSLFIGLALLCISLALINNKGEEKTIINIKWIVYVLLAFFGNGMCSTVQQMQQRKFGGEYKSEFMIAALLMIVIMMVVLLMVFERKIFFKALRSGFVFPVISGAANGAVNLFVMLMLALVPASVMFPLISAGDIVVTSAISVLFYKEKLTKRQLVGILFGVAAIVFLNL